MMMRRAVLLFGTVCVGLALAACDDDDNSLTTQPEAGSGTGTTTTTTTSNVASPPSSATRTLAPNSALDLTAIARDAGIQVIEEVLDPYTAGSGNIAVTASAGNASASVSVDETGNQLSISGPSALALNDTNTWTVSLLNAAGSGIADQVVEVSSVLGNPISSSDLTTDASGQIQFNVTGAVAGTDAIVTQALGLTTQTQVEISFE